MPVKPSELVATKYSIQTAASKDQAPKGPDVTDLVKQVASISISDATFKGSCNSSGYQGSQNKISKVKTNFRLEIPSHDPIFHDWDRGARMIERKKEAKAKAKEGYDIQKEVELAEEYDVDKIVESIGELELTVRDKKKKSKRDGSQGSSGVVHHEESAQYTRRRSNEKIGVDPNVAGGESMDTNKSGKVVVSNVGGNKASSKNASSRGTRNYVSLEIFEGLASPHLIKAKTPERIEVLMGDVVDSATFCMVQKSDLDAIKPMEMNLTEQAPNLEKRGRDELVIGQWITAYRKEDKMWFRASVADFYTTYRDGIVVDAYLLDHGLTLMGIKYPDNVRNLPPAYKRLKPYAFQFKLHGLVPQNLEQSSRRPEGCPNKWADVTSMVAHMSVDRYEKAQIHVISRDLKGRPKSGKLILELNRKKIWSMKKYMNFLEKGGYTERLPMIDFSEAYVNTKLAKYAQHDWDKFNKLHPSFTAWVNFETMEKREVRDPRTEPVDQISRKVRRLNVLRELDEIIESDNNRTYQ